MAFDPTGTFAVAWDQVTAQTNGVVTDSQIVAKYFDNTAVALTAEFQADSGVGTGGGNTFRTARNPQLDLDENGNMTIVWEAFEYVTFVPGSPEAATAYQDTLGDMVLGLLGALVGASLAAWFVDRALRGPDPHD